MSADRIRGDLRPGRDSVIFFHIDTVLFLCYSLLMKALFYIKNNPQKTLFICFIVLFIASLFTILFPGYTEVISYDDMTHEPVFKEHVCGGLFYVIGIGLGLVDNARAYDLTESVLSIIFICIYLYFALSTIIFYILKKRTLSLSLTFLPLLCVGIISANYYNSIYQIIENNSVNFTPINASQIFMFIIAAIAISIDIARLVHYLKTHPRTPRPRKPLPKSG